MYAEIIKKIIFGNEVDTSLKTLLANIDGHNKSVPSLEELNEALSALSLEGYVSQLNETRYVIYPEAKEPSPFKPISAQTYKSATAENRAQAIEQLNKMGISTQKINEIIQQHEKLGGKGNT